MPATPSDRVRGAATGIAPALAVVLALATILAYARVAGHDFTSFDDDVYVTKNAHVRAGLTWTGVVWAFTTGDASNWHPLTWLSHMLDVELFGMRAAGHHLTSLAIHVASTLLLFHVLLRTTKALAASAFVAAVFALHPLHVESVAWIAERKDVLCAFFWILALLAYVRWLERPGATRYAAVLACHVLGLLAKPMIVTLPFTLLLLDVWPLRRAQSFAVRVREKIPLFALSLASSVATFLVQRAGGSMARGEATPFLLRLENAAIVYVGYLGKAFVPVNLQAFYPHPFRGYPIAEVLGAVLLLALLTAGALRCVPTRPWLAVGWLWFLGTLVPVIGLVQVGWQSMADRYTYVPMIGLAIAVGFGVAEFAPRAVPVLAVVASVAWTGMTWRQVGFWKDDATLAPIAGANIRDTSEAHAGLGNAYLKSGRIDEAIEHLRRAVELDPGLGRARNDLGMALDLQGRTDEALAEYREAVLRAPDLAEAHHNLAGLLAARGQLAEALEEYRRALAIQPDLAESRVELERVQRALEQARAKPPK
jgi:hypothetical protein